MSLKEMPQVAQWVAVVFAAGGLWYGHRALTQDVEQLTASVRALTAEVAELKADLRVHRHVVPELVRRLERLEHR